MKKKALFLVVFSLFIWMLSGCNSPAAVQPAYTTLPTYTPYPTYTPAASDTAEALPLIEKPTEETTDDVPMIQEPTEAAPVLSYATDQTVQDAVDTGKLTPLAIQPYPLENGQAIQFGLGETSAVVSGSVPANGTVTYSLYAMAKQNFVAILSSTNGSAVLGISDDRGQVFLDTNKSATSYNMYLPRTATYYLDIFGGSTGSDFTLQVFIPARVTIPVEQRKTKINGSIGAYGIVSYTMYMYAGQTAKIDVYSGATPTAFLRISGMETGSVYLDYTSYMPSWYAIVPATQDYLVEVITLNQQSNYRLTFNVY